MEIELSKEHTAKGLALGTKRHQLNTAAGVPDTKSYAGLIGHLPLSPEEAHQYAVLSEIAALLLFGQDPSKHTFVAKPGTAEFAALKGQADLTAKGRKIEIRNACAPGNAVSVYTKDVEVDAIVVQTYTTLAHGKARVVFLGQRNAAAVWRAGLRLGNIRKGRATTTLLKPMEELF